MQQENLVNLRYLIRRISAGNVGHWTVRYVINRIRLELNYKCYPADPWLTRDSIRILEQLVRPEDIGFEWGSGRSTVWFAHRTRYLTSIEHNREWYTRVSKILNEKKLINVDYQIHELTNVEQGRRQASSYVQSISNFDESSLDYILVDGCAREHCACRALSKLKPGGILIIDNVNWFIPPPKLCSPASVKHQPANSEWESFWRVARTWRRIWTSNCVTDTLILIRS